MYIESEDVLNIILVGQDVLLIDLSKLPYRLQEEILCFLFFREISLYLTSIDLFLLPVQVQLNLDIFQQMLPRHPSIKKPRDKQMCSKPF